MSISTSSNHQPQQSAGSSSSSNVSGHFDQQMDVNDQLEDVSNHHMPQSDEHMQHNGDEFPQHVNDEFPQSLENIISQEQALALQHIHAFHQSMPLVTPPNFPRPTVKRRKPVKWEAWEEKNLIEGVRRFGRGNWAQIRAAFEFNQCRTNVDLHDKWRVLTGERKRNRQAQRMATPPAPTAANVDAMSAEQHQAQIAMMAEQHQQMNEGGDNNAENQDQNGDHSGNNGKVQLIPVAGTNGLYTLSSFLPPGFNPAAMMEGGPGSFPDFLQSMQNQSEMHDGEHSHLLTGEHNNDGHIDEHVIHHSHDENITPIGDHEDENAPNEKRQKKSDDSDIAQELLKLSKADDDDLPSPKKQPAKRSRKAKK